jgi:single-stranded-DNA-specific exonuclease
VQYIKAEFSIRDDSTSNCFPGIWWGHYKEELPTGKCDCIAELDYNTFKKRYEIRLIAVRPSVHSQLTTHSSPFILDWRHQDNHPELSATESVLLITACPTSWDDLRAWFRRSLFEKKQLAIAWNAPQLTPPSQIWQQLVGIAKYLNRTGQAVTRVQLCQKLGISDQLLLLGFQALSDLGFQVTFQDRYFQISSTESVRSTASDVSYLQAIEKFLLAVREEQFQRQYFDRVPLTTIQAIATQIAINYLDRS